MVKMANTSTNFMNSNHRRIFRSAGGRYFVRTAEGAKQYKPKAIYYSKPGGENQATAVHGAHAIPRAIRPKGLRRARASGSTGTRALTGLAAMFASPVPMARRGRGRPRVHHTNDNRKAARRAASKRYYMRKRAGLVNLPRL